MKLIITLSAMCCVLMSGCWRQQSSYKPVVKFAQAPAPIAHIVFVTLKDPSQVENLRRSVDYKLGTIPSVAHYASGSHLDTGRASVLHDYDLAIYLLFNTEEDLAAYVAHEQHIEFVEQWKPAIESLKVYDMLDGPNPYVPQPMRCIRPRKRFLGIF